MDPKVSIVVLNYKRPGDTIECLASLKKLDYPNFNIIVVDNDSKDDSIERIKQWVEDNSLSFIEYNAHKIESEVNTDKENESQLIIIKSGENIGYAGGNNVGIKYALLKEEYNYIWLLNNDTVVDKDALSYLVRESEKEKKIGVAGSRWMYYDKPDEIQLMGGSKLMPFLGRTKQLVEDAKSVKESNITPDYIGGASFLIRTETIRDVGLLDEDYFLYWEDADWCERIRRAGWKLKFVYESVIYHKGGASTVNKSPLTDYYGTRNSIVFIRKYYKQFIISTLISVVLGRVICRLFTLKISRIKILFKAAWDGMVYNPKKQDV